MATIVRSPTKHMMLIRAQLSLEQYAVFEWCAKNLGIGELDDKETILKLLEPHFEAYQNSPKEPPPKPEMDSQRAVLLAEYNRLAEANNENVYAQREGRLTEYGLEEAKRIVRRMAELRPLLGISEPKPTPKPIPALSQDEEARLAWLDAQEFKSLSSDEIDDLNYLKLKKNGGL